MFPDKGLFTDCRLIDQPHGTYRDARNIILTKLYKAILNEPGFEVTATGYPNSTAKPLWVSMFPDNTYVIFSDGIAGGKDRIGVVDLSENYTDLIVDNVLGFDSNFPIKSSEIDYNYLKQRIVAWTDKNQTPKILNIDAIPFALDGSKALVNPLDISDLEIFTVFSLPLITGQVINGSGSLPAGNLSFAVAYENNDGTRTANCIPQKNFNIIDDSINDPINSIDGCIPGNLTSKSVQLTITNVDTRYDKLVLIGISRINNIVTAFEIKKIDISSTTVIISYIGTELTIALSLEEVTRVNPLYKKVGAMTQGNNILYHANLEAEVEIDYQKYANDIQIFYNTKLVSINDILNSHKNNLPSGFPHGAVIAFYIRLLLKNGSTSRAFPIPGRTIIGAERSTSSLAAAEGFTAKIFQFEDTTNLGGHSYALDGDTTRVTSMASSTNMGFWENQDEVYPTGFPDFATQKVRHHVFPTMRLCKDIHYSGDSLYGVSKMDVLGIDINNVIIPAGIKDQVVGWQILYAKRDYINSNTLGNDLFLYGHWVDGDNSIQWSAGGNWNTNTRNSGGSAGSQLQVHDANGAHGGAYMRGHGFELMKDKPQLASSDLYFDIEMKLSHPNLDSQFTSLGIQGGNLVGSGTASGQNPGAIIDYTASNVTVTNLAGQTSKRIEGFKYLPSGIIDGVVRTVKNEEAFQAKLSVPAITPALTLAEINISTPSRALVYLFDGAGNSTYEETYLITYRQLKTNLYANYDQQLLIATDSLVYKDPSDVIATSLIKLRGGDTFVSLNTFVTTSPFIDGDFGGTNIVSFQRGHICESRYNIGLRYEILGNTSTKYYPKENPFYLWSNTFAPQQDPVNRIFDVKAPNVNGLGYSNDFNAINDIIQSVIYNPSQIITNKFPFRVIRSGYAGTNSQALRSWKTYLIADKYEANRNREEIENITMMDDVLLIHHRAGLFRTLGKEKILTSTTEVYLGTGDIFAQQPKEVIPSRIGMLGNQNIFASFSFKGGYAWLNQRDGAGYLLTSNGVDEITDNGLRQDFINNLKIDNTLPNNPFTNTGLIGGYDKLNNRLLFTKRGTNPFTISYSLDYKCWVCYHDYLPNIYFYNNNNLFCLSDKVYKCDSSTKKAKYLDNTIYPSYIDLVYNPKDKEGRPIDTLVYNLSWVTELYNASIFVKNKTLTSIQARNNYQDTGEITLVPFTLFGIAYNTRALINGWNFNKLRTPNADVYKKKKLIDKYTLIKFKYSNVANLDSSQNSLYLYDLDVEARKVEL